MLEPAFLTGEWRHERSRPTTDGGGGWTAGGWAAVQVLRLRVRQATAREVLAGAQLEARVTHFAYADTGTGVQRGDRFRQGIRGLVVQAVAERVPPVGFGHLEAQCEEVVLQPQPGEDQGAHES